MTDAELLDLMGTDAAKWAEQWCRTVAENEPVIDEGFMIGWFANAIEAGRDAGRRER